MMSAVFKTVMGLNKSQVGSTPIHFRHFSTLDEERYQEPYMDNVRRHIPAVHKILNDPALSPVKNSLGEGILTLLTHKALSTLREEINNIPEDEIYQGKIHEKIIHDVLTLSKCLPPQNRKCINATGIILHTGLGRAPLGNQCAENLNIALKYNLVQIDPLSNQRSLREEYIEMLMHHLSGAEASTIVNNNAAATFLMLRSLFTGKEVIISRGHLVEIGGSYRMPDIMAESGCIMKEVGTTNKTHLKDYASAITENTGAFLYVHQSNFRIHGFASIPSLEELCTLGKKHGIPVIVDLGSGALVSMNEWGLPHEPTVREVISAGVLACCFSGDKLIGGPQAGIICGSKSAIETIRKNSFSRMFRVCKLTLRGMETALSAFANGTHIHDIPVYQMLSRSTKSLEDRGAEIIKKAGNLSELSLVKSTAYLGGGSTPDSGVPSCAISIPLENRSPKAVLTKLHLHNPLIFPHIHQNSLLFEMRTIDPEDDIDVAKAIQAFLS